MRRILLGLACIVALAPIAQGATTPSLQSGGSVASCSGQKAADLVGNIDKALARLPKPSAYLYETNSVSGTIASTWTEMTAGILGTRDLRVAYDNFYQTSVEYSGMVAVNLLRARRAAQNNDVESANRLCQAALRYESQFYLNDKAAIEAFNGNIDAVTVLTKGIYQGSKAAAIYGSSMVFGPVGSRVVDTVFGATDFAVETSENGLSSATKKLVADKLTEMIFSQATVGMLGGKTMKDALERGVTKTMGNPEVYKIVREVVSKPEFAKAFMSFMAKSGAYAVSGVGEDQVNKIVMAILETSTSKLPQVTDCGSKWYQTLPLQYLEVFQATVQGGYSFNTACQAHDRCYGDCKTGKSECDNKLLADAKLVCDSAMLKTACISGAKTFYNAVSNFGDKAFSAARANCPASSTQAIQTTVPPKNNADLISRTIEAVDLCHHWAEEVGDQTPERNKQIEQGQKRDCPPAIKLLKENFEKYPNDTRLFNSVLRMNSLGIFELPQKEISRICSFMKKDNIYCQSADLATQDIRNIDFRNFTYDLALWCGKEFGKTRVRIKNGGYGSQTDWWFGLWEMPGYASIVYGDLTGDGRDEAIVTTSCGGMHATEQPYIFTMKDGRVSLMTRLESGDRAFGGYHRITIKDGLLLTERMQGKAACCPDIIERKTYKWSGTAFVQVGAVQKRQFK